ncbi:MAG: glutamyl-tRNA reductase [Bryobacterales bacterium]|nr:glutamyl-tRNA reductase [Bryobacterales bacterium]
MKIQLVGMNHRTAPLAVRERLVLSEEGEGELARELTDGDLIEEAVVLSTCNRVEVIASGEPDALHGEFLRRFGNPANGSGLPRGALYNLAERQAVRHVFRVASSLDSMVVGEPQILGQVRGAYQRAKRAGALGGPLERLISHAFHVARRVRNETEIGKMAVSVSQVAVDLARKIFGDLEGLAVLLIGAGEMAEGAARHLKGAGAERLWVTNRTAAGAERLASGFGGETVPFERFLEAMQNVDIVISSTRAPGYVLSRRTAEGMIAARRNRPIFLVDIAVPRDIDPAINEIENVFVYDIDDLQQVAASNMAARRSEAELAERIIDSEVERTFERINASRADPAIVSLNQRLESIRQGELERHQAKLRGLTGEQLEAVDQLTRSIINKVAHHPIRAAKRSAADPSSRIRLEDIRRIFGLD